MFKNAKIATEVRFASFSLRWIYYYGSNKSTGKETGKMPLCALLAFEHGQVQRR